MHQEEVYLLQIGSVGPVQAQLEGLLDQLGALLDRVKDVLQQVVHDAAARDEEPLQRVLRYQQRHLLRGLVGPRVVEVVGDRVYLLPEQLEDGVLRLLILGLHNNRCARRVLLLLYQLFYFAH